VTRQSFIRCPGDGSCAADLPVKVTQVDGGTIQHPYWLRLTDHPSRCPECKTDWSQSGWPEYPQGELAAAYAEGEESE